MATCSVLDIEDDCYPMNTIPRGRCVIINNVNFNSSPIGMPQRIGSDLDADKLTDLFENFLKFKVTKVDDVTENELYQILHQLQTEDHQKYCAFVVILLSHGDKGGVVYCCDGVPITIKKISEFFTTANCPSLSNKPKLFFIQACRGQQPNQVIEITGQQSIGYEARPMVTTDGIVENLSSVYTAPNLADFLFSFATVDNCTAMRDMKEGSWYVNELIDAIREFAESADISYILTKVAERVSKYEHDGQTQVPELTLQLRKKLKFFPNGQQCSSPDVKSKILKEENEKQNFDVSSDSSSSITSDKPLEASVITYHTESNFHLQGYCIIINNIHDESDKILEDIKLAFGKELGFNVEIFTRLHRIAIRELLVAVASVDHTNLNCLLIIILSEGKKKKYIYGTDGKKISTNEAVSYFSSDFCQTLIGKPKLFLLETLLRERDTRSHGEEIKSHADKISDLYIQHIFHYGNQPKITFIQELAHQIQDLKPDESFIFTNAMKTTRRLLKYECDDFYEIDNLGKPLMFTCGQKAMTQEGQQLGQEIKMALNIWSHLREAAIKIMDNKRDKIVQVCRDARRSRVAGALTSIAGGALTIVGLGLIPVTFGGSLAISGVGAAMGVAGGITSLSATMADTFLSKAKLKDVQSIFEVDRQLCEHIKNLEERLEQIAEDFRKENPSMSKEEIAVALLQGGQVLRLGIIAARGGVAGAQVARAGSTAVVQGGIFAARVTGAAVRGVAVAGGVISVLILPLDIYELASNTYKLYKQSESNAIQWLNEQIIQLKEQKEQVDNFILNVQQKGLKETAV